LTECGQACLEQALAQIRWEQPPELGEVLADKRATFSCTPGLQRPPARIAEHLWAAGDYVDGPYPATLEGAVRSGRQGMRALLESLNVQSNFAM